MNRPTFPIITAALISTSPASAWYNDGAPSKFPSGCSLPGAPISSLSGVDTAHASMAAKIRRRDVVGVRHDGGGCQVSIPAFLGKTCTAGTITIDLNGRDARQEQTPISQLA